MDIVIKVCTNEYYVKNRGGEKMQVFYDSRQIPSDKSLTGNKKYSDLLYGYLQVVSEREEGTNIRYIEKKNLKFTKIAADLQISRQTVASRLNNLIDMGLLRYDEVKKRYEFITIQKDLAALLPKPTVRILCNTLRERSLSILAYLLKSYFQHGQKPFNINIDILKAQVGLSSANRGTNNEVITDTLILLKKLGFIDYKVVKEMDKVSGGFKTVYILLSVDNYIDWTGGN